MTVGRFRYGGKVPAEIDDDAREEYWLEIRRQPVNVRKRTTW